jgi:hypothetical protein
LRFNVSDYTFKIILTQTNYFFETSNFEITESINLSLILNENRCVIINNFQIFQNFFQFKTLSKNLEIYLMGYYDLNSIDKWGYLPSELYFFSFINKEVPIEYILDYKVTNYNYTKIETEKLIIKKYNHGNITSYFDKYDPPILKEKKLIEMNSELEYNIPNSISNNDLKDMKYEIKIYQIGDNNFIKRLSDEVLNITNPILYKIKFYGKLKIITYFIKENIKGRVSMNDIEVYKKLKNPTFVYPKTSEPFLLKLNDENERIDNYTIKILFLKMNKSVEYNNQMIFLKKGIKIKIRIEMNNYNEYVMNNEEIYEFKMKEEIQNQTKKTDLFLVCFDYWMVCVPSVIVLLGITISPFLIFLFILFWSLKKKKKSSVKVKKKCMLCKKNNYKIRCIECKNMNRLCVECDGIVHTNVKHEIVKKIDNKNKMNCEICKKYEKNDFKNVCCTYCLIKLKNLEK